MVEYIHLCEKCAWSWCRWEQLDTAISSCQVGALYGPEDKPEKVNSKDTLQLYNDLYYRLITDLEQQREEEQRQAGSLSANQWHEVVDDLWTSEQYLQHLREDSSSVSYVNVFDPSTELYGFQSKPDNLELELLPPEQLEPPVSQPPSSKPVQEPAPSAQPTKG